jgi:DNA-binding transcriptional LysR family regulator
MDTLTQMRVFTTVVDKQSFTTAAELLGMAKSTVSRQIADLESRLGARLLYRTTRVIRPTDVGRAYYERCAAILADIEEADAAVRERGGEVVGGTLHVACAGVFASLHLMSPLASFRREHPDVRVDLRLDDRHVNLVEDGIDLAIRITARLRDSSLVTRRLATTRHGLWAAPAYVAAHGTPRVLDDLARHATITRDPPARSWEILDPDGERTHIEIEPVLTCSQGEPVLEAVRLGMGIGMLPDFMSAGLAARGELVRVLPEYQGWESGVYAVYPHKRLLSGRVRAFIDHLARAWDPPPWAP